MKERIVVGISGASGVVYGIRLLEALAGHAPDVERHLVITPSGERNIALETDVAVDAVREMADAVHDYHDLAAPIASGSFPVRGMVVAPCSIRSLSDIAHGHADNLLARAADVTLKEGRRLILVPRETPLHKGHLKLMLEAVDNGAVILPPVPAFYHRPATIADIVDQTVGKILDRLALPHTLYRRWGEGV
jgi:4-hydroxy-3-polyprenylbenzoate decarboxylase